MGKNIILYCCFVFRSVIKKLCCFFLFLQIYPKTLRQINQGIYFVDYRPTVFLSSKAAFLEKVSLLDQYITPLIFCEKETTSRSFQSER